MSVALAGPAAGVGSKRRALRDPGRERDDFYPTPPACAEALLRVERFQGPIWECACGDGAMSRVMASAGHAVVSTDLVDRGYGESRRDFLMELRLLAPNVVTNPPFKLAEQFVLHALQLGAEKVAIFGRTALLEGQARHRGLFLPYPPVRVWQYVARQTLWRGDEEPAGHGAIAFAWFVWERGYAGAPALGWLP